MIFNKVNGGGQKVKIDGQTPPGKLNLKKEKIWKRISTYPLPNRIKSMNEYEYIKSRPFIYKKNVYTVNQYPDPRSSSYLPETQQMKFENNEWVDIKEHNLTADFLECGSINGEAYAIMSNGCNSNQNPQVFKFNGSIWEKISEYKTNFLITTEVIENDGIYILIEDYSGNINFIKFNVDTKQWTIKSVKAVVKREEKETKIIKFKNEFHFLGSTNWNYSKKHYKYNGSTWTTMAELPEYCFQINAIESNNKIYIFGARANTNYWIDEVAKVYEFNGSTWTLIPNFPLKKLDNGTGCLMTDGNIYLIGVGREGTCIRQETIYTEEREV